MFISNGAATGLGVALLEILEAIVKWLGFAPPQASAPADAQTKIIK